MFKRRAIQPSGIVVPARSLPASRTLNRHRRPGVQPVRQFWFSKHGDGGWPELFR